MVSNHKFGGVFVSLILVVILASTFSVGAAHAAPTTITAYKATIPVNINGAYSASSWTDTPLVNDSTSGVSFAVKQNGSGWLFLMRWQTSASVCSDTSCYGGIELGPLSNTAVMGSASAPTIMILASPSFQGMFGSAVNEFISTGFSTPASVGSAGYSTQSVCGTLALSGTTYTVQCYRPFSLKNASPDDFPTLGVGSTIEIGFAVGEFNAPGTHSATTMSQYQLTFSASTFGTSSSSSSSSSSSQSTSTSTTSSASTSTSTTSSPTTSTASSSASTFTAYKSQYAINVNSPYVASQWKDTQTIREPTSGMSVAFKQNGTGLLFLMMWNQSSVCSNSSCYGGIELGSLSNTAAMGASSTPTIMVLAGPSFKGDVDEFISTGTFTPTSVETDGYKTQTVCGLTVSGSSYTAICYRPFTLANASPYDPKLAVGSTVELGFAVGEFNQPGVHDATNMQSYVLTISASTIPSNVSTTGTVTPPATSSDNTFPGLNVTTLFVISAIALLVGVVLGIGVSIRSKKAVR